MGNPTPSLGGTLRRTTLVLLAALAILVGLDNLERPLANPDEGRYSVIAREMAHTGDWVTPRLNGLKYFEKPPLQYWATAAAFKVFGESEIAARAYTAFCGLVAILAVFFTMRRLRERVPALVAVSVLLTSPYFLGMGGIVTLDMGLTAWLTVAVGAFLVAQARARDERERRRLMLVAWAAMALAVLSKGLVGIVIPAAAIFLHCLVHRDWRLLRKLEWGRGLAVFLVIAAPWFILVARENPEFARFFFIHEHFERFLTPGHRRVEPWWYFPVLLLVGVLPWMLALLPAAVAAWKADDPARDFPWRRFAVLWSGFVLVFFSVSSSKLPAYILPAFPMLALVLGDWIEREDPARLARFLAPVAIVVAVALFLGWGAPERAHSEWTRALYLAARPWIVAGGVILVVAYAAGAWLLRRGEKLVALVIVVMATLVFIDCAEDGFEELSPRQSGLVPAAAARPHIGPDTRVYSLGQFDQSFAFYLGRTVTLVDYRDEFALGQKLEPRKSIETLDAFVEEWKRPGSAVAIMQPGFYDYRFQPAGLPMVILHRDDRRLVVRKP
jgi:4-amino-4-deoxy-L-arabinose transferase-like glycosyltransferase